MGGGNRLAVKEAKTRKSRSHFRGSMMRDGAPTTAAGRLSEGKKLTEKLA